MCLTCRKTPKTMRANAISNTRLLDVQPTTKLTVKRRAPITISAIPKYCLSKFFTSLLFFRRDKFVAFAMDVDDLNLVVLLQMLTQLSNIDIHRTGIKIVIINPNGLQCEIAL